MPQHHLAFHLSARPLSELRDIALIVEPASAVNRQFAEYCVVTTSVPRTCDPKRRGIQSMQACTSRI